MKVDYRSSDYPEHPYPGARPDKPFIDFDGGGYWLHHNGVGWVVTSKHVPLDVLLSQEGAEPLAGRDAIIAYGSNESPGKINWLRQELGLRGPVIALPVTLPDLAGVWCAGIRPRDGARPVVLAHQPEANERHTMWLTTANQRKVLDQCEDRGRARRLVELHHHVIGPCGGTVPGSVLAYTAAPDACGPDVPAEWNRSPLVINGQYASMYEYDQATAAELTGTVAETDGITCTTIPL